MSAPGLAIFARALALDMRTAADEPALDWEALSPLEREAYWAAGAAMQVAVAGARAEAGGAISEPQAVEAGAQACFRSIMAALGWKRQWAWLDERDRAAWRNGVRLGFAAVKAARAASSQGEAAA